MLIFIHGNVTFGLHQNLHDLFIYGNCVEQMEQFWIIQQMANPKT